MKTERRHSLETNELAAGLTQWIEKLKPYTGQMVTGLVLLAAVYVGLAVWDSFNDQREAEAWDAFALANDMSDREMDGLQRVASDEKYAGTAMQEWAYVGWADRQLLLAQQEYLIDRDKTNDRLRGALGIYETMSADASDAQVRNRARFGLARVYEMQNKIDEAREQYLLVRGDLEPHATKRAARLESEEVRQACNWLATADLPTRSTPATGSRPAFEATTPAAEAPSAGSEAGKSLEELLGELNPSSDVEDRYEDSTSEAPAAEESSSAATEADESPAVEEKAAEDEATE